jgi:hypothetical protein
MTESATFRQYWNGANPCAHIAIGDGVKRPARGGHASQGDLVT